MPTVTLQGVDLEFVRLMPAHRREASPPIVFLHEGLGSVSLWRDFPQRVADACGAPAVVYSRQGHGTWLNPAFRDWNVESCLPRIECPVLAIEGEDDEYATMDQFNRIVGQVREVTALRLARCGHSPHRDQAEAVISGTLTYFQALDATGAKK